MGRLTTIYVATFGCAAAVLWGIFALGSHLTAPSDVSGDWTIDQGDEEPQTIRLHQSGRFLHVTPPGRETMSLTLDPQASDVAMGRVAFRGKEQSLLLQPRAAPTTQPDDHELIFRGRYNATLPVVKEQTALPAKKGH